MSAPVVLTSDQFETPERLILLAVIAAAAVVRVGVATDWVEANDAGLEWRTIVLHRSLRWDEIEALGIEGSTVVDFGLTTPALLVTSNRFAAGSATIHASYGCERPAIGHFIDAAEALRVRPRKS